MALHNGPRNAIKSFEDLKKSLNSNSISNFNTEEFKEIISQLTISSKALLQGGIQVNNGEDILSKLDAIILILELSIAAENLPENDKKRDSIQLLQNDTLDEIIKSINNINQNSDRWCNPDRFQGLIRLSYRSAHQRLLMINNLLFYYAGALDKNIISADFSKRFIHFPLKIEDRILEKSKKEAANRTSKALATESNMVICCLKNPTYNQTSQFSAIKEYAQQTYIEPNTGLELDFPLNNKITIELDGDEFHFIKGKPTLEHLRKEKQLLENGWIRISLSTSMLKKYDNNMKALITAVSYTLSSPPVVKYIDMHQLLATQRSELREQIRTLHEKTKENVGLISVGGGVQLKSSRQSQSQKKKKADLFFSESASSLNGSAVIESPLSQKLGVLLKLENKISTFLGKNHLDKIINNDALHTKIDAKFKLLKQSDVLCSTKENLGHQIEIENEQIKALERKLGLNTWRKKSNNPQWAKKHGFIEGLKKEERELDKQISAYEAEIKRCEQELVTLLSTELHFEELSDLNQEVSNWLSPSGMEVEDAGNIQVDRSEKKVSASSAVRA